MSKGKGRDGVLDILAPGPHRDYLRYYIDRHKYERTIHGNTLNVALLLDKFVPWRNGKFDYFAFLKEKKCFQIPEEIAGRMEDIPVPDGFRMVEWRGRVEGGLVIGMGAPHVHETALSFHRSWGIPYIPGTALKGLLRTLYLDMAQDRLGVYRPSCMEAFLSGEDHPRDAGHRKEDCPVFSKSKDTLKDEVEEFRRIFGTKEKQGEIVFMDAYPVDGNFCLEMDVMSVHYPDYYRGEGLPADWSSPNIIYFVKVVNTGFRGLLISRTMDEGELERVRDNLKRALETYGIGAKTAVGYGVVR